MKVLPIPIFKDNYAYAIVNQVCKEVYLVDPSDFKATKSYLSKIPFKLTHILSTHNHWDHCRDNLLFINHYPDIQIFGGVHDNIPGATRHLQHNQEVLLGGSTLKVIHTPCHTKGHVMFLYNDCLFTGDTLFICGCGRFFEGTPADMWNNFEIIKKLPPDTRIYCGHEYTLGNLEWASKIWKNSMIELELDTCRKLRSEGKFTVPSSVGKECMINIFMNADKLKEQLGCGDHIEALAMLRDMKNRNVFM